MNWFFSNAHWIFEGIGTALIGFALGWVAKGYQVRQSQTSGSHSQNVQVGRDIRHDRP
jgi:hypothetical protein